MKSRFLILLVLTAVFALAITSAFPEETPTGLYADIRRENDSPEWVVKLPAAQEADQLFVVAGIGMDQTTAYISMHQKDEGGNWKQILSTPGFVGKNGLCADNDHKEGCGQTPAGIYRFNKAFGIAADPAARSRISRRMRTPTGPAIRNGSTTRWLTSAMCRIWLWTTASTLWIMSTSISTA